MSVVESLDAQIGLLIELGETKSVFFEKKILGFIGEVREVNDDKVQTETKKSQTQSTRLEGLKKQRTGVQELCAFVDDPKEVCAKMGQNVAQLISSVNT